MAEEQITIIIFSGEKLFQINQSYYFKDGVMYIKQFLKYINKAFDCKILSKEKFSNNLDWGIS